MSGDSTNTLPTVEIIVDAPNESWDDPWVDEFFNPPDEEFSPDYYDQFGGDYDSFTPDPTECGQNCDELGTTPNDTSSCPGGSAKCRQPDSTEVQRLEREIARLDSLSDPTCVQLAAVLRSYLAEGRITIRNELHTYTTSQSGQIVRHNVYGQWSLLDMYAAPRIDETTGVVEGTIWVVTRDERYSFEHKLRHEAAHGAAAQDQFGWVTYTDEAASSRDGITADDVAMRCR